MICMKEEELKRFRDYANHYQGSDVFFLMEHINEQAKRIATMKAICTKERFWQIWKAGECQTVERATQKAKDQLAKEYPEINWDE